MPHESLIHPSVFGSVFFKGLIASGGGYAEKKSGGAAVQKGNVDRGESVLPVSMAGACP